MEIIKIISFLIFIIPSSLDAAECIKNTIKTITLSEGSTTDDSLTIESPNFPNKYQSNIKCGYEVQVPESVEITVTCTAFNLIGKLDKKSICNSDGIKLSYNNGVSNITQYFCGKKLDDAPNFTTTVSGPMMIDFFSNNKGSGNGFQCNLKLEKKKLNDPFVCNCGAINEANPDQPYPWIAQIFVTKHPEFNKMEKKAIISTGTIISTRHILTYAIPFYHLFPKIFPNFLNKIQIKVVGTIFEIQSFDFHPNLETFFEIPGTNHEHFDLGIFTLSKSLTFSPTIKPICLYNDPQNIKDFADSLISIGWTNKIDYSSNNVVTSLSSIKTELSENECYPFTSNKATICGRHPVYSSTDMNSNCAFSFGNSNVLMNKITNENGESFYALMGIGSTYNYFPCAQYEYGAYSSLIISNTTNWIKNIVNLDNCLTPETNTCSPPISNNFNAISDFQCL